MAKRGERKCIVCGTKYVYCPNCGQGNPRDSWKNLYDTMSCKEIFRICSDYAFKHISATEAKAKLEKFNIKDYSKFTDDIRKNLLAINAEVTEKKEESNNVPPIAPINEKKVENVYNKKHHSNQFVNNKKD